MNTPGLVVLWKTTEFDRSTGGKPKNGGCNSGREGQWLHARMAVPEELNREKEMRYCERIGVKIWPLVPEDDFKSGQSKETFLGEAGSGGTG